MLEKSEWTENWDAAVENVENLDASDCEDLSDADESAEIVDEALDGCFLVLPPYLLDGVFERFWPFIGRTSTPSSSMRRRGLGVRLEERLAGGAASFSEGE